MWKKVADPSFRLRDEPKYCLNIKSANIHFIYIEI